MSETSRSVCEPEIKPSNAPSVVPANLLELDFRTGSFSKTEIAGDCGKSEGAVRKVVKVLRQAIPLEQLEVDKRLTELGTTLILSLFERPEGMSQAEWLHALKIELAAIPDCRILQPENPNDRTRSIAEKRRWMTPQFPRGFGRSTPPILLHQLRIHRREEGIG